jgi:hypothetical protein
VTITWYVADVIALRRKGVVCGRHQCRYPGGLQGRPCCTGYHGKMHHVRLSLIAAHHPQLRRVDHRAPCNCAACRTPACVGEHILKCGAGVRGPSCRPDSLHEVLHPVAAQRVRGPVLPGGTTCRARYCWQPPGTLPPMPSVLPPPPAAAPCHVRALFWHLCNGVYELDQRPCHAGGVAAIFRMQLAAASVHVVIIVLRALSLQLRGSLFGDALAASSATLRDYRRRAKPLSRATPVTRAS